MVTSQKLHHCGIDFGTTNSSLAVSKNNLPQIIPIDRLNKNIYTLRSLIYITPSQNISVGYQAINNYLHDLSTLPSKPVYLKPTGKMVKVMTSTGSGVMKADWVPEIVEVDDSGRGRLLQSLKSVLTSQSFTGTNIFEKFYSLEELLTTLMKEIKSRAEANLNYSLDSAVIGRPIKYVGKSTDKIAIERMTTIAKNAGFKNVQFEYEPVGAALNYGINIAKPQTILVYDFGGGTLDICIMRFPDKKIVGLSGRGIGGDLLDTRLIQSKLLAQFGSTAIINNKITIPHHFYNAFNSWYQTTLQKSVKNIGQLQQLKINSNQPEKIQNLITLISQDYGFEFFQSIDNLKISLTNIDSQNFIFKRPSLYIAENITRHDFETAISDELSESNQCITETLNMAGLIPSKIDKVILTGGSSQTPIFINQIVNIFGSDKIVASDHFTSVASGLAIIAEEEFS